MKNNKDIMFVKEKVNKKGETSFELHCSYKDPFTKEYKQKVQTYLVPSDLRTKKEIAEFRLTCQLELKNEVDKIVKGVLTNDGKKIYFIDYATKWVEDIIRYNKESYLHYSRCKNSLPIFKEKFGLLTLEEMTLPIIQNFCDWLCERTYKKETIVVKKSIRDVIKSKGLTFDRTCRECGISDYTLCTALKVGNHVDKTTAKKICSYLEINFETYFNLISEVVQYSKSANKYLKNMLHCILAQAVKERLIPYNYASPEYTKNVTGKVANKKQIFESIDEIHNFIDLVNQEKDLRKRTAFLIGINLGLRGAEISGLEWKDIDFDKQLISINKNTIYAGKEFGIVTKTTKTKSSKRIIKVPNNLMHELTEYRDWWNIEKINHGDLWAETDRLFVQNGGKDMSNQTISNWLKEFEIKNNLKRVTLHGLRHTNITMQITNGVDIKTVSVRAGHNDIQTTLNIYSHYTAESDKKASDVIDKLLCF